MPPSLPTPLVVARRAIVGAIALFAVGAQGIHGLNLQRDDPSLSKAAGGRAGAVTCRTEQVRMRDGTLLATDIYLPSAPGRYPVVLQRTPYGLRLGHGCFVGTSGTMAFWAEHGYAALTQDVRGTADGFDTVEWAAAQPWSTGKVGMAGSSYFGLTQWQAAITTPPHLFAIAPAVTASDYHDQWTYVNGVFDLWFAQSWILNFFAPDEYRRQLLAGGASSSEALESSNDYLARGKQNIFTKWVSHVPLGDFPEFRTLAPYYYEWLDHPDYDDYWASVDVERHFSDVRVPALITGGWSDLFAIGSVRSFEGMRAKGGSEVARNGSRLVMQGGGAHGGPGVLTLSPANNIDARALQLRFYDHHLKGADNGIDRDARVQLFVQIPPDRGTQTGGFWVTSDVFPLPETHRSRFYLRSAGHANTSHGDGVLDPDRPPGGPGDSFMYDPKRPVPTLGGGLCCVSLGSYFGSGAQDQSALALRDDVLVYTSAPLAKDLAVVGQVEVRFWATSSARDTDFTAKLVDVHPDGFAQNILDRVVRASLRKGSKLAPSIIQPGMPYDYVIDLGYSGTVFRPGHRIRLDISSSNFPHFAANPNTGRVAGAETPAQAATQTIWHDPDHPAFVELPVVPGLKIPQP
ncbi:MAG: X-Pro dipeptidyl-peptidase [Acidobacteria bacterium]|nr:MAG: X-Pro dipeptidyl-peptidase [Acidobacteriota bacterium]